MSPNVTRWLITIAVAGVVGAGVKMALEHRRTAALTDSLTTFVGTPDFTDARNRCQADASHIGPITSADPLTRRVEIYAYDGGLGPATGDSPAFSTALADKMQGKLSAIETYSSPSGTGVEIGIATPWRNGKCALMLVRLPPDANDSNADWLWALASAVAAAIAAGLVARFAVRDLESVANRP